MHYGETHTREQDTTLNVKPQDNEFVTPSFIMPILLISIQLNS